MGDGTAISWSDNTKNLWIGCWKIAPECANCYADDLAARYWPGNWGRTEPRRFLKDGHLNELFRWNRRAEAAGKRERVFVGSLMDWAERHPVPEIAARQDEERAKFWPIAKACTWLDFQMLTKRPEDAAELVPWADGSEPWPNVWIGVSAGHRDSLDKVQALRQIPAAVRFISCEPLLSDITAEEWDAALAPEVVSTGDGPHRIPQIDWLIVGNESGSKRRAAEMEWVRTARDAAARNGVAFHFKQWVEPNGRKVHLPVLDGEQHAAFPPRLGDGDGEGGV